MTRLKIDVRALANAVTLVAAAAVRSATQPILAHLKFDVDADCVRVSGTDHSIAITARVSHAGDAEPGVFTVNAEHTAALLQALARADGAWPVELEQRGDGDSVLMRCERGRYRLATLPPHEFPVFDSGGKVQRRFTVTGAELRASATPVLPAVGDERDEDWKRGVCCDTSERGVLRLVATDGHRLHVARASVGNGRAADGAPSRLTLPPRALSLVARLLGDSEHVEIALLEANVARFRTTDIELRCKVLSSQFADYEPLLTEDTTHAIEVSRDELAQALNRLDAVTNGCAAPAVQLTFSSRALGLVATHEAEGGEELLEGQTGANFKPLRSAFHLGYLRQAVDGCPGDTVQLEPHGRDMRMHVRPANGGSYRAVVMPIRL